MPGDVLKFKYQAAREKERELSFAIHPSLTNVLLKWNLIREKVSYIFALLDITVSA
jgi:hypothetical protein